MANGIVRLEDMPSVIPESEVPTEIIVPNPGDRKVVITPEESGIYEEQVFTSDCLPDEIPYKFLGMVQYPDGSYYPKYIANVATSQKLGLRGKEGEKNGVEVMNESERKRRREKRCRSNERDYFLSYLATRYARC